MKNNAFSLSDALDTITLPNLVTTSQKCMLNESFALEPGYEFTVLQRQYVKLLFGTNWHGKNFQINTAMLIDLYVDVVDEIYPKNLKEIRELLPNINYILCKATQNIEFFRFDKHETFADLDNLALITNCGRIVYQSLESLLNKERFVFVHCKKTVCFNELLSNSVTKGTIIRFINGFGSQVPTGNVVINDIHECDSVLTVRKLGNQNKLLYQVYKLDSGINVFLSNKPLPLEVIEFGSYGSDGYYYRIREIMSSIHYEIYSPSFYGRLIMDISVRNDVKENREETEDDDDLKLPNDLIEKTENKIKNKLRCPKSLFLPLVEHCLYQTKDVSPFNKVLELSDKMVIKEKGKNKLREGAIRIKRCDIVKPFQLLKTKNEQEPNLFTGIEEYSLENLFYNKTYSENYGFPKNMYRITQPDRFTESALEVSSKSCDENLLMSSFSESNHNYRTINTKHRDDRSIDSGIDSPDANEVFEQLVNSTYFNDKSAYDNVPKKTIVDGINETLKKKHSKSDLYLYEEMHTVKKNCMYDNEHSQYVSQSSDVFPHYTSINYLFVKPRRFSNDIQKREIESFEEIYSCSIKDLAKRLHGLQLSKFVKKFKQQMINGRLLINLSEDALIEIGLSHFEARKLYKYIYGWRVNIVNFPGNLEDAHVSKWSAKDVKEILKKINLHRLADFAVENQIDGALLEDLIRNNYIKTLDKDHGIQMKIVEVERLRGRVCGCVFV